MPYDHSVSIIDLGIGQQDRFLAGRRIFRKPPCSNSFEGVPFFYRYREYTGRRQSFFHGLKILSSCIWIFALCGNLVISRLSLCRLPICIRILVVGLCFLRWCGNGSGFFDRGGIRIDLHHIYFFIVNRFVFFGKDRGSSLHNSGSWRCHRIRHAARRAFFFNSRRLRGLFFFNFRNTRRAFFFDSRRLRGLFFFNFRNTRRAFFFDSRRLRDLFTFNFRNTQRALFFGSRRLRGLFSFDFRNRRQRPFNQRVY